MKRLTAAVLALTVIGGTAAEARHFGYRDPRPAPHAAWNGPGYGPGYYKWKRGDYFRPSFGRPMYVNDWRMHRLRRPPIGYNWVRYDNSYLLVALATGMIADIVANSSGYGYGANAYGYGY